MHKDDSTEPRQDMIEFVRSKLDEVERSLRHQRQAPADEGPVRKLLHVVEELNASLDPEKVLRLAAARIIDIFDAERVFIMDLSPDQEPRFRLAVTFEEEVVARPENEVSHAVVREVAQTRAPVLVADATRDERFVNVSSVHRLQLQSVMAAPLLAVDEIMGVVYVDNRQLSGVFDEHRLDLLSLLANHVGIAMRNARLFAELGTTRAQLAQAERLKALGEVAAIVVHEIRNPLGSIQIMAGALCERWDDERLREKFLKIVPAELERLNRGVQQILDYARPTPLAKVPVELAPILDSALSGLQAELQHREVRIHRQYAGIVPAVLADGERLRGVFINLIRNAMEAMADAPQRELRVELARESDNLVSVVFEDAGSGAATSRARITQAALVSG